MLPAQLAQEQSESNVGATAKTADGAQIHHPDRVLYCADYCEGNGDRPVCKWIERNDENKPYWTNMVKCITIGKN